MNSKWTWSGAVVATLVLSACSGGSDGADAKKTETAWGCETKSSDRVVCTSAMTLGGTSSNSLDQYACAAGDVSAKCPDDGSVKEGAGVADILVDEGKTATFDKLSWACMTTGKHQVQCSRDLTLMTQPSAPDGDGPMQQPANCSEETWEPYFAQLASKVYKGFGYNIDFPREIFNSRASMIELVAAAGAGAFTPAAPSCHVAEWALRADAWVRAVGRGCVNLTAPILVWCQQAANYAPETHECNASGSWADH